MSLKIQVKKRKGALLQDKIYLIDIDKNATLQNLKQKIFEQTSLNTVLDDNNKPVALCGLVDNQLLIVKDIGPQMLWRTVFYMEYFGPIAIVSLLYFFGKKHQYTVFQNTTLLMAVGHFLKRELETMFVHVFSRDSMPKKRALLNVLHYWILFGLFVGFEMFCWREFQIPNLTTPKLGFLLAFIFFEFMNLMCHITLSNLRKKPQGSQQAEYIALEKQRAIPFVIKQCNNDYKKGFGFNQVSCANYFWEIMSWVAFSCFTGSVAATVFTVFSFGQMLIWAKEKHRRYKKEFGDKYPRNRKAMVPFLI